MRRGQEITYTVSLEDGSMHHIPATAYTQVLGKALERARDRQTRILRVEGGI